MMNKLISSILMITLTAMTASGQEYGIDFNNDGFIDEAEKERGLRVEEVTASVSKSLQLLENMSKAQLTDQQVENIFGVESRGSCNALSGFKCVSQLSKSILKCVPKVSSGFGIVSCVKDLIGAGHKCVGCICWVVAKVSSINC